MAVRSLYDLYPTFDIDVSSEQAALQKAQVIVLQHPMYWYSVPSLLKHWFDKVLARGFAYGQGGKALWGKRCFWVVTTGGDEQAFGSHGMHGRPFREFMPVVEQTALFCGMSWEEPLVVYGAHRLPAHDLELAARDYRDRLASLVARVERGETSERQRPTAGLEPAALDAEPPAGSSGTPPAESPVVLAVESEPR